MQNARKIGFYNFENQAWELRMEKSAEKWEPQKALSGGPEGNSPSGDQGAKPPEPEAF